MEVYYTIFEAGASIERISNSEIVEAFVFRNGGAIPNGVSIQIEVEKNGEWKSDSALSWVAGQEDEMRSFGLKCGQIIRATVIGGSLPAGMAVQFS